MKTRKKRMKKVGRKENPVKKKNFKTKVPVRMIEFLSILKNQRNLNWC